LYINSAKIPKLSTIFGMRCAIVHTVKSAQRNSGDQRGNTQSISKLCVPNKTPRIAAQISFTPLFPSEFDGVMVLYLHIPVHSAEYKFELGAKIMFKSSFLHIQDRGTAEERLWRAVITKTLEEWMCGPLSFSRKAEQFLFDDNKDFRAVCSSAGMDPERLRKRLKTLRARGIQKEIVPFRLRTQKKLSLPQPASWGQRAYGV
jgi:hypothetical protein